MTAKSLKSRLPDAASDATSYGFTRRRALRRMLTLAAAGTLAACVGEKASADTASARSSAVIYKIVTVQVPQESMERFLAISATNAAATRKEPGALGFEVLIPDDTPNTVIFIETYRNAAASDSHSRSAHFLAFKEGAKQTGAKESVVVARRYMPK